MRRRNLILTLAGGLLLAGATVAAAGAGARGRCTGDGPHGPGGFGERGFAGGHGMHAMREMRGGLGPLRFALRHLDLTAEQRAQIDDILDAHREANLQLREQLREELGARLDEDPTAELDEAAVRARAERHARLMIEAEVARARVRSEVLGVLTPAQREELRELRERAADRLRDFADDDF